jgi:hypothetical protein
MTDPTDLRPPMIQPEPTTSEKRRRAIREGFKKAIRREVARLHELGLPVYVAKNGTVVVAPAPKSSPPPSKP